MPAAGESVIFELNGADGLIRVESLTVETGMVRYRVTVTGGDVTWSLDMPFAMLAQPALGFSADRLREAAGNDIDLSAPRSHAIVRFDWDDPDFMVDLVRHDGGDYVVRAIPAFWDGGAVLVGEPRSVEIVVRRDELERAAASLDLFAESIGWSS
jgi:hypothetical protein